ncbi:hypothetical protein B7692_00795 [Streptococcus mitis]|uniref:AAA+ ATPase domain-containing protein n=1 Tax=Streptococcus mitis TaxID=28037 RepID=A0A1X1L9Q2_STRMT|nr:NB-ARC domain-containing protein [Streptococcus mitis]ORP08272.1 hypothetical protein B7692_00795 [Streptococcus mitis]
MNLDYFPHIEKIVSRVTDEINDSLFGNISDKIISIVGEKGYGKSTIISKIDEYYQNKPYSIFKINQNLMTFERFFEELNSKNWAIKFSNTLSDSRLAVGIDLPIGELVKNLLSTFRKNHTFETESDEYYKSKFRILSKFLQKNEVILLIDDFDKQSDVVKQFFYKLLKYQSSSVFDNLTIIFTTTKSIKNSKTLHVEKLSFEDFQQIVNKQKIDDTQLKSIYSLINGNLHLVTIIQQMILGNNIKRFNIQKTLKEELLTKPNGENLYSVLRNISLIDKTNINKNLATNFLNQIQLESYLNDCINENLLIETTDYYSFASDYVLYALEEWKDTERYEYSVIILRCFDIIYPGNYQDRHLLASKLGLIEESEISQVLNNISDFKRLNISATKEDPLREKIQEQYELIISAINYFISGNFEDVLKLIEKTSDFHPYLKLEILDIKFQTLYNQFIDIIRQKELLTEIELEINRLDAQEIHKEYLLKFLILKKNILLELSQLEKIDSVNKKIEEIIAQFPQNSYIDLLYYAQKLNSNMEYSVEIAEKSLQEAYNYFNTHKSQYPKHYIVATINYLSNLYLTLQYRTANRIAKQLLQELEDGIVPCYSFGNIMLINNISLLDFVNKDSINAEILENIHPNSLPDVDLIKSNFAVMYFLKGDLETSLPLIKEAYFSINRNTDVDSYYKYYIYNNYAFINLFLGNKDSALAIIEELLSSLPDSQSQNYFKKRNQLLSKQMKQLVIELEHTELDVIQYNSFLLKYYPEEIGIIWQHWGQLLLLSPLEIWE